MIIAPAANRTRTTGSGDLCDILFTTGAKVKQKRTIALQTGQRNGQLFRRSSAQSGTASYADLSGPRVERSPAPAKINLTLRVIGRRADGYHFLDSLMLPVSLFDDLVITARLDTPTSIEVYSDAPSVPGGPANLAYRAAAGFLDRTGKTAAITVELRKRIPVGSGLGGGSSDAATVLLALNRLFGRPLTPEDLSRLGLEIGADVPFFVRGGPARVRGIGEHITPIDCPRPIPLVLCWDHCSLSTKEVYRRVGVNVSLTTVAPLSNITSFVSGTQPNWKVLVNDLEPAAAQIHPDVLLLKAKLMAEGALGTLMTGSGGAVFGVWPNARSARETARKLRRQGLWAVSVQTLATSPAVHG